LHEERRKKQSSDESMIAYWDSKVMQVLKSWTRRHWSASMSRLSKI